MAGLLYLDTERPEGRRDRRLSLMRGLRGSSVELWMNLQRRYDVECAWDALGDALKKITPLQAAA